LPRHRNQKGLIDGLVVYASNPSTQEVRQENGSKFKASLDYILVPCIKKESFIGGLKLDGGKKNKLET
jgi:hypothetical protein